MLGANPHQSDSRRVDSGGRLRLFAAFETEMLTDDVSKSAPDPAIGTIRAHGSGSRVVARP